MTLIPLDMANDSSASERLKEKQKYYENFERLQDSDDGEPDPGREDSFRVLHRKPSRTSTHSIIKSDLSKSNKPNSNTLNLKLPTSDKPNSLTRSVSDPTLTARKTNTDSSLGPNPRSNGDEQPGTITKSHTFSGNPSSAVPSSVAVSKATGKRKRDIETKLIPKSDQIFKDLYFYFFPNTDTHPARRMRIAKAVEYGAVWEKDWNEKITHVILDKSMTFEQLTKFLKLDGLPENVVLVSENYPSDCISYRSVLDPKGVQFRVKGFVPQKEHAKEPMKAHQNLVGNSRPAMEIKLAGKSKKTQQNVTSSPGDPEPPRASYTDRNDHPDERPRAGDGHAASTDELDAMINQARELQHVPLDIDDDVGGDAHGYEPDNEKTGELQLMKQRKTKMQRMQDKFSCMQKHTANDPAGPNAATIAILQQMADYYNQIGDEWRTRAYRKAMGTLRNHSTKVWTKKEALALPQIGDRLATKIEEIAFTNRLRRLKSARADPIDQILQTFMKVYGAGYATASDWVRQGFTTLDDLVERADLTDNQRIGIEHYDDFNRRIPRTEVAEHGKIVTDALRKIDPTFEVIVGGSYRRGSETSGDIDCMITRPKTDLASIRKIICDRLVPALTSIGFLVAALATSTRDEGSKWHGASCLPSSKVWRRIDFLYVPSNELGAALIYFTGNDIFNRSLRLLASTKGMRLNQRGLFKDVMRGQGRVKVTDGKLVEGKDEKRIFDALGVPWRPPEHRIC